MEGLIPYLVRAIKRQNLHNQSFRCLSDGSRRSYHLLGNAGGDSVNGSSHRRTQSEFQAPTAMDLQPEVDQFVRSRSMKSNNINMMDNKGLRQTHHNAPAAYNYNYDYGDRLGSNTINKFHQY
ncbi:hypothetical protein BVRB_8g189570 [Beta vulgaris subsp. vulgaris]|uniref:uncharacterized protein LOC104901457 n=1 Tax=Beta vulgaris subsp. vulgaris TaxID=3555 RepID=UPI00053FB9A5|nr:uncharacterized protein LOC104901457 [Beta vulgaris subsp. vulgaris]KMT03813.1 hypothetical protein BVRB_8g189570 [Beta vulgaris subsp. vulgaris]